MEATILDNTKAALHNLREAYGDIYEHAQSWMVKNPEEKELYPLFKIVTVLADYGMGRCNVALRMLGEQE